MVKVIIVSGDYNSGKTNRLINIYQSQEKGTAGGFACIKDFSETAEFIGYSLKWLSSGVTFPLAVLKEYSQRLSGKYLEVDRFLFSEDAFHKASVMLNSLLLNPDIRTVFIDEIGVLEINGKGYSDIFTKALQSDKNIYVVINKKNIEKIVSVYSVKKYEIV